MQICQSHEDSRLNVSRNKNSMHRQCLRRYEIVFLKRPGAAVVIVDRSYGRTVGKTEDFARIFKLISDATFRKCAFPGTLVANGYGPH